MSKKQNKAGEAPKEDLKKKPIDLDKDKDGIPDAEEIEN